MRKILTQRRETGEERQGNIRRLHRTGRAIGFARADYTDFGLGLDRIEALTEPWLSGNATFALRGAIQTLAGYVAGLNLSAFAALRLLREIFPRLLSSCCLCLFGEI
jgi:hypothetical protein